MPSGQFCGNIFKKRPRQHAAVKQLRIMSVPDDRFALETRLVVLNFMGLVPASCPATASLAESRRLDDSIEEEEENDDAIVNDMHTSMQSNFWPAEEANDSSKSALDNELSQLDTVSDQVPAVSDNLLTRLIPQIHLSEGSRKSSLASDSLCLPILELSSGLGPPMAQPQTLSPHSPMPQTERQLSHRSSGSSTHSRSSGRRNSYVDVRVVDVHTLARMSPLALPLREEIFSELNAVQTVEASGGVDNEVLTPESEVAEMLRKLGDQVQEEFGDDIQRVAAELVPQGPAGLTYDALRAAALKLLNQTSPGWTQVALVLLLGQRVVLTQLQHGNHVVGKLADYTTQFIGDHVAEFIIRNGGWQSILELENDGLQRDSSECSPIPELSASNGSLTTGISTDIVEDLQIGTSGNTSSPSVKLDNKDEADGVNKTVSEEIKTQPTATSMLNGSLDHSRGTDEDNNGGTVYVTICALAVVSACFLYQRLFKS